MEDYVKTEKSFYFHVLSDADVKGINPENTLVDFRIPLDDPMKFSKPDRWEVALSEIEIPGTLRNITGDMGFFRRKTKEGYYEYKVPPGLYTPESFARAVNTLVQDPTAGKLIEYGEEKHERTTHTRGDVWAGDGFGRPPVLRGIRRMLPTRPLIFDQNRKDEVEWKEGIMQNLKEEERHAPTQGHHKEATWETLFDFMRWVRSTIAPTGRFNWDNKTGAITLNPEDGPDENTNFYIILKLLFMIGGYSKYDPKYFIAEEDLPDVITNRNALLPKGAMELRYEMSKHGYPLFHPIEDFPGISNDRILPKLDRLVKWRMDHQFSESESESEEEEEQPRAPFEWAAADAAPEHPENESFYGGPNIRNALGESAIKFLKWVRWEFYPDFRWNNEDHRVIIYNTMNEQKPMYIFDIARFFFDMEIGSASIDTEIPQIFLDEGWKVPRGAVELRLFMEPPFPLGVSTATREALEHEFPGISITNIWQLEEIIKMKPDVYNLEALREERIGKKTVTEDWWEQEKETEPVSAVAGTSEAATTSGATTATTPTGATDGGAAPAPAPASEEEEEEGESGLSIAHDIRDKLARHFVGPENTESTNADTAVRLSNENNADDKLVYNQDTKTFYFRLKSQEEWEFLDPDLRFMMGFDHDHGHPVRAPIDDGDNRERKGCVTVRNPADFSVYIRQMYVYANLIKPVPVGWQELKLLRIVPIRLENVFHDNLFYEFERPEYHTLSDSTLREIHITLRTFRGTVMPFSRGRSKIKLHFRKKATYLLD